MFVCGGGPSGISAAISSARLGAETLLIERYGKLGAMAVQSLVGPLMGGVQSRFVDEVLARIGGRSPNMNLIDVEYYRMLKEARADVLLHTWISGAISQGNLLKGVTTLSKDGAKNFMLRSSWMPPAMVILPVFPARSSRKVGRGMVCSSR